MQEPRLTLKSHVLLERDSEEDDVVLIDSRSGRMTACNETATMMVAPLQAGSSITRLVEVLRTTYKVSDEIATRDINAFLDVLAAEGYLDTTE